MPSSSGRAFRCSHSGCCRDRLERFAHAGLLPLDPVDTQRRLLLGTLRIRSSIGSMPSCRASSSTSDSIANAVGVAMRRAVRARAEAVGADRVRLDPPGLEGVRAADLAARKAGRGRVRERAAVDEHACLERRQRPVLTRPDLEVNHGAGARSRRGEVLAPRQGEPHRPADAERRADDQRLDDRELAAEAATERRALDAHLRQWKPVDPGDVVPDPERRLRARADRDPALSLRPRDRDLRLEVGLVHPRGAEPPLGDGRTLRERRVEVALGVRDRRRGRCPRAPPRRRRARPRRPRRASPCRPPRRRRLFGRAALPGGSPARCQPRPRAARTPPRPARPRPRRRPRCRRRRARPAGPRRRPRPRPTALPLAPIHRRCRGPTAVRTARTPWTASAAPASTETIRAWA